MGSVDWLRTWLVQGASKEFDWVVIHGNWVSSPTGKEWHKDLSKAEILRVFAKPAKRLCADNSQPEANMTEVSDEVWKLERDEFAEARSHEASKISYDFGKAAAQAGLIIN